MTEQEFSETKKRLKAVESLMTKRDDILNAIDGLNDFLQSRTYRFPLAIMKDYHAFLDIETKQKIVQVTLEGFKESLSEVEKQIADL